MLFYVKTLFLFSIVTEVYALTAQQKSSLDQMKEAAKAYQSQVQVMQRAAVRKVESQDNPVGLKTEDGGCPIGQLPGQCGLSGSQVIQLKNRQKADPYLMQGKKPVVFVSASMPVAALKHLGNQAKLAGAVLVIKGFVKGTLRATADLVDEINCPLEIDPKLFEKCNVHHVPTIMVHEKGEWHKVTGNVEIGYAIELASKKSNTKGKAS